MRAYLVCILDSDNYREPTFLFFKNISDAHEHIKNLIISEMKNSKLWSTKTEINYVDNSDGSDDQILRIDYSFGDGVFYVHTVHEIEVEDQDYICVYHHAYNGVGFYIEKIGSLEECQQQMKTSAINSATDFGVDMKNDGFFEVNNRDSCVDVGEEWHMCDIVQFNVSEILKENESETDIITNVDLFNEIVLRVKESESWPDKLIEYASANNHDKVGLYNYEFDPHFVLKPGGSEGYYLDLGIYGNYTLTDSVNILNLGTIKTLEETEDGIRQMAVLYGECLIAYEAILRDRKNLDAITRKGFDLHFMDSEGKISNWGYSGIKDRESALQRFHEYHEMDPDKYARAIIRDNMTRKEKTYA